MAGLGVAQLAIARHLGPVLEAALVADTFPTREAALVEAFEIAALQFYGEA